MIQRPLRPWISWIYTLALPVVATATSTTATSASAQDIASETIGNGVIDARVADALLTRPVTVTIDRQPLTRALKALASSAGVSVQYNAETLEQYTQPVTLHVKDVPLGAALETVLAGTRLRVVPLSNTSFAVIVGSAGPKVSGFSGALTGIVRDAKASQLLSNVTVLLDDSVARTQTDRNGRYRFPAVTAGIHRVTARLVGFARQTRMVTVVDDQTTVTDFTLSASVSTLTEIVTTATGDRRRMEVGNAVGTIQADSIVPTTMIRNMSDLLQARVPGVVVTNTDGAVGAPSKIRLRGVNSLALNNDPIIILDGVRLNAQSTTANMETNVGSSQMLGQAVPGVLGSSMPPLAPSRLDDLDPNTIESIDVLRGPSASSLYGTDAANGVIVIKTKQGRPGTWRATVSGDNGTSSIPGEMPEMWWGWGHYNSGLITNACTLATGGFATVSGGGCVQDSVTQFNPQNNTAMKTLGTGTNRSLSATLSGGTPSLLEFLSGRVASNVGMAKMSDAEARLIGRLWSSPAPSWMTRPNTEQDVDGSSRTTVNVTNNADISLTTTGMYRDVLNGGSGINEIGNSAGYGSSAADTLSYLPSENQRTKVTSGIKRGILSTTANYRPLRWLSFSGAGGGDYGLRVDQADLRAQDCSVTLVLIQNGSGCPSGHTTSRGETFVVTANGGAHLNFTPVSWINLQTALGEQYNHTNFYNLQVGNSSATNCPLAFGTTLLTPTPVCQSIYSQAYAVNESRDEAATAGVYLEETVTIFGIYSTFGVRKDVASAFGGQVTKSPPNYPKLNFSYPLSEQSFFPKQSLVSNLRLRIAYGQSGNQASQAAVLNNYALSKNSYPGTSSSSNSVVVTQVGNPNLKPEKGTEWEGGFDVSFLENERLHAEVTLYRKYTRDAITTLTLAPSYGVDNLSQFVNLGNVENRGLELALTTKLLDTRFVTWDLALNATKNTNKLVHKAPGLNANGPLNTQFREGYPLYGYWGLPVVSYADVDGNGFLDQTEVQFGTQQFLGAPYPTSEITYNTGISLWNGAVRLSAVLDQINGQTTQLVLANHGGNFDPRAAVDPSTSFAQQAGYIQAVANNYSYIGTSSSVRLNELSVTYNVPPAMARRLLHVETFGLTLAGRNVGLWSSYAGKDPNIDTSGLFGEATQDNALGTPQPRFWTLRFNLGL